MEPDLDQHPSSWRPRPWLGLILSMWLVPGCASFPDPPNVPAWTSPQAPTEPTPEELTLIERADAAHEELVESDLLLEDAALAEYLSGVFADLQGPVSLPSGAPTPSILVVRLLDRNAFVDPAGRIYLTVGVLSHLSGEDELAGLLGHEFAHLVHRDSLSSDLYSDMTNSTVGRMKFSRARELAADDLGAELALRAGYDPLAMRSMLRSVHEGAFRGYSGPRAWSSHPDLDTRVRRIDSRYAKPVARHSVRKVRVEEPADPVDERMSESRDDFVEAIADLLAVDAELALEARLHDQADESIGRHLELRPESGRGYFLRGEYLRLTRDEGRESEDVLAAYERAHALAPDDPEVLRALGLLLRDRGDRDRAAQLLGRYLEVVPDAPDRVIVQRWLSVDSPVRTNERADLPEP